jgi:phosphate transport system substrate-binding protein
VNYQGIGSGGGIEQFTNEVTDFGASDAPMSDEELAAARAKGGDVLHIPMVLGAVVATYNVKGVNDLKLDGPTLADIFLGKIKKWNDPRIEALNGGTSLPASDIKVVHRSDSSGTSYIFTGYLSAVSSEWKSKVGQDKAPEWPTGVGGEGNDGVAAAVQQTDGAIGYNELAYAIQNKISYATLKNASGEFVKASLDSTSAAGKGVTYPEDLRFSLLNSKSPGAYPIVSATWQLVWKNPAKAGMNRAQARALATFLTWELSSGQKSAPELNYAPLPKDLQSAAVTALDSMVIPAA